MTFEQIDNNKAAGDERQKKYADKHRSILLFEVGGEVLLNTEHNPLRKVGTRKLAPQGSQAFFEHLSEWRQAEGCPACDRNALFLQSKRGNRDGNDIQSGDEQTGSPLHVLSELAQRQGSLATQPSAPALGADSTAPAGMQTRDNGTAAAGEAT